MEKRIHFRRSQSSELQTQFWLRTMAFAIDYLIVTHIMFPLLLLFVGFFVGPSGSNFTTSSESLWSAVRHGSLINIVIYLLVFGLYSSLMESSSIQATLGKRFLSFKVCDTELNRISFLKSFSRFILKVISIATVIGVFIIDMTPRRQGFHDLVVQTIVIRR